MLGDLMNKMQEAKKQMEEAKKKMESVYLEAEAENGLVKVTATANKKITNITIADELIEEKDKETIEDLVITAINKVIEKAEKTFEAEMSGLAKGMLPNIP
jgi:DNA-binding YbaB/EbfC family protein